MMFITVPFIRPESQGTADVLGYTSILLSALFVFFGIRSYRENAGEGRMTFGRGLAVGLHRPISLMPFPTDRIRSLATQAQAVLVVEMNAGQMVEDVRLAVEGRAPVHFLGRMGGVTPLPEEIEGEIDRITADRKEPA